MTLLTKIFCTPSPKNFFRVQTRRLAVSFKTYRTGKIPARSHVRLGFFYRKSPKAAGCKSVKYAPAPQQTFLKKIKKCQKI